LDLQAVHFELCPEMTAKLCRLGVRIAEVPVSYRPRGATDGKKIGWRDGASAVWTLLRWRVAPFRRDPQGRALPIEAGRFALARNTLKLR
jgi:dolichol-phosphate mannosyltransferase